MRDLVKEAAINRESYIRNRDKRIAAVQARRKANPEKHTARSLVSYHIRVGNLVKQPCSVCGNVKVDAHHHKGYTGKYKLDVMWLCRLHHRQVHGGIRAKKT